jgi:hypothetical protein
MATGATARLESSPAPRRVEREAVFVTLTIAHAVALVTVPSIPLIAVGLWWNANTIAHNFIHRPFFDRPAANRAFSACLSLVLGIPQSLWRQRHLQHHAEAADGHARPVVITRAVVIETALVLMSWVIVALLAPRIFAFVYLPGWVAGLALCQMQGHYEHARGTTSHYGWLYNLLFFNDGYHVEHHRRPAAHWRELPALADPSAPGSRWPAVLRWLDRPSPGPGGLEILERLVLRSSLLQRFVVDRHERAFRALLPSLGPVARITVVGGGLFPRTALILRRLLPHASLTIVDASATNLETARRFLDDGVTFVHARHDPADDMDADLVVVPLAYRGDRRRFYRDPPAARVIVHDWIWSPRPKTALVSVLLLKRLNLVRAGCPVPGPVVSTHSEAGFDARCASHSAHAVRRGRAADGRVRMLDVDLTLQDRGGERGPL